MSTDAGTPTPRILRLRNGFIGNTDGSNTPTYGEYVMLHDYHQLERALAAAQIECSLANDEVRDVKDQLATAQAEIAALRELHNIYNLGGMTDYNDGPMKRALAAEQRAADLQARLDRVTAAVRNVLCKDVTLLTADDVEDLERALAAAGGQTESAADPALPGLEILASHSGKSQNREWHSVGTWLYPGEAIYEGTPK